MADQALRDAVLARLAPLGPVRARAMFGGHGLYLGERFFGLIAEGRLYFRTDEASRSAYVERGMRAFQPSNRPRGAKTAARHFEVPAEVFEDADALCDWALRASETEQPKRRPRAGRRARGR